LGTSFFSFLFFFPSPACSVSTLAGNFNYFFFPVSIYFLLFYILISLINIQDFSRCFFFSFHRRHALFLPLPETSIFFPPLPEPSSRAGKSSPSSPNEIQPKIKIQTPWRDLNPSSPSLTKRTKNTNFGDQQKGPKWSKNHHKKGPEITKKEASSVARSLPFLDLDLYFFESPNLPGWWR
jgi:hypothetical protein